MTKAWIENDIIRDIAPADPFDCYHPDIAAHYSVDVPDDAENGDTFKDGVLDDYTSEPHECDDYVCVECKHFFGSESAFGDDPNGYYLENGEYKAFSDSAGDVWVTSSPYFTRAQFCSPCAPGACYLMNECQDGERAFCFGHDWFEDGKAPYTVYSVETGEVVPPPSNHHPVTTQSDIRNDIESEFDRTPAGFENM